MTSTMLRNAFLALLLTTTTISFAPTAAAECEPLGDPGYCSSAIRDRLDGVRDRVDDIRERLPNIPPDCEVRGNDIACE